MQSAGIGDGDVAIHAVQKNRMVAGNLVYIPARGDGLDGPEVFVPAAAQNPVPWGGRFDLSANAFAKLVERLHADEIDVQTLGPAFGKVDVRVIESGHDELPAQIDYLGLRAFQLEDLGVLSDGFNAITANGNRLRAFNRFERGGFDDAGVDVAVHKDEVRFGHDRLILRLRAAKCQRQ